MIEKLHITNVLGEFYSYAPDNYKLMEKINEIIDYINKQEEDKIIPGGWTSM